MIEKPLLPLSKLLQACPSRQEELSEAMLFAIWRCFKQIDPEHGDVITSSMLVGLILYDKDAFKELLNETEHAQLAVLGRKAHDRYLQLTNPPNPLGKALAEKLKESI
jgi:hypothetical protein